MVCISLGLSSSRAATLKYARNSPLQGEAHSDCRFSAMSGSWRSLSSQINSGDLKRISSWCRIVRTLMASATLICNTPQMLRNSLWLGGLKRYRYIASFKNSVPRIVIGLSLRENLGAIMDEYPWRTHWSAENYWKSSCFGILILLSSRWSRCVSIWCFRREDSRSHFRLRFTLPIPLHSETRSCISDKTIGRPSAPL